MYMPAAKACKAYKFARPFYGPYQIIEQNDLGVVVQPVNRPLMKPIRVVYDQVQRCSEKIPDEFWSNGANSGRNQRVYGQKSHSGLCDSTGISHK